MLVTKSISPACRCMDSRGSGSIISTPESHTVCNYYPDFLILRTDGSTHLVEFKSGWKANDPVVVAKTEAAERLAEGSRFHYSLGTKDDFQDFLSEVTVWKNYTGPKSAATLELN